MNYFNPDELQTLISIIRNQHGLNLTRQQFTDISFDLFEDISGLEGVDPEQAMEIFKILKDESRELVLEAFIERANITPKGSATYFYNVTRKLRKQKVLVRTRSRSISWDNGLGFFKEYRKIRFVIPKNSSGLSGWKHPLQPSIKLTVETWN